ncbi:MAG: hypothetical protein WCY09_01340 [Candidatus Omnitrophota bacterium]
MALKKKIKKITKKKTVKKTVKKIVKKTAKKIIKKTVKNKPLAKTKVTLKKAGKLIGIVTHYFPHVQAAVIKLKAPLAMGETLKIKGHTTDFTQTITSMQMDRVNISKAKKGDEIGLQVSSRVRQDDKVYKL